MTPSILITCLVLALMAGPLGCFVVWRRMAYFGDGLAHSALLGVAVSLLIGMSDQIGMVLIAVLFAISLLWLRAQGMLATDTLLGILAHAALALGILSMALMGLDDVELHDYLLGELTRMPPESLPWLIGASGIAFGLLLRLWPGLVLMTTSEELAQAEGVLVRRYEFMLMLLMGAMVAVAVQVIGVLLITSLLIIPASTARLLTKSPEAMAIGGSLIAALSMLAGLPIAEAIAAPVGPTIVSLSVVIFIVVLLASIAITRIQASK